VSGASVALAVAAFIAFEGGVRRLGWAVSRCSAFVAVLRIEVVVHVAVEVGGTVEPLAGSDEVAACEPFRAVVAVRGAVEGGVIVVAVRAGGLGADVDADGNLGIGLRGGDEKHSRCGCCGDQTVFETLHDFHLSE
jgi:hypothetical protein